MKENTDEKINGMLEGNVPFKEIEILSPTPLIDFHYGNSTAGHTNRIIEVAAGLLQVTGNMIIDGLSIEYTSCDNLGGTGFYIITPDTINKPFAFWSILLQVRMNDNYKAQLAFPLANGETTGLKYRVHDGGNWFPWKTISMT